MNNVVLMFSPTDEKTPYKAGRESYGHTVQSVAARSIVHKFLKRSPGMDQAWKGLNGFIVSFTSSFDQLKIWSYTEI